MENYSDYDEDFGQHFNQGAFNQANIWGDRVKVLAICLAVFSILELLLFIITTEEFGYLIQFLVHFSVSILGFFAARSRVLLHAKIYLFALFLALGIQVVSVVINLVVTDKIKADCRDSETEGECDTVVVDDIIILLVLLVFSLANCVGYIWTTIKYRNVLLQVQQHRLDRNTSLGLEEDSPIEEETPKGVLESDSSSSSEENLI